ncbi:hypothetical protein ACIA98_03515 [Streptomyces sp. NPDC051366]|uniref:hypothetical protein n=1 Tax=Streptomyces sp. NPDC051366 TaxID=3365652 RepID=UPI0037A42C43
MASAARQVSPAAGRDPGHPVLGCVLVEFEEDEVRFVARPSRSNWAATGCSCPGRRPAPAPPGRPAAVREEAEPVRIGFEPAVPAPALEAAVGPDFLLEIFLAPGRPVLVRSADQGSFTTLVMPVALPARPPGRRRSGLENPESEAVRLCTQGMVPGVG